MNFNNLALEIHAQNKAVGWWDNPDQCIFEKLQLCVSESGEATEGERKNLMDDHLPHRKMGEVELADIMIRLLDLAGRHSWEYKHHPIAFADVVEKIDHTPTPVGKHFWLSQTLCSVGLTYNEAMISPELDYSLALDAINYVAYQLGYDIESAMMEKIAYNKNRADHKRENRAAANGKKC